MKFKNIPNKSVLFSLINVQFILRKHYSPLILNENFMRFYVYNGTEKSY